MAVIGLWAVAVPTVPKKRSKSNIKFTATVWTAEDNPARLRDWVLLNRLGVIASEASAAVRCRAGGDLIRVRHACDAILDWSLQDAHHVDALLREKWQLKALFNTDKPLSSSGALSAASLVATRELRRQQLCHMLDGLQRRWRTYRHAVGLGTVAEAELQAIFDPHAVKQHAHAMTLEAWPWSALEEDIFQAEAHMAELQAAADRMLDIVERAITAPASPSNVASRDVWQRLPKATPSV